MKLTATISRAGFQEVEIRVSPGEREKGLALLERLLPAFRDFDRFIRERERKPREVKRKSPGGVGQPGREQTDNLLERQECDRAERHAQIKLADHFCRCADCQVISEGTGRLCHIGQRLAEPPWRREKNSWYPEVARPAEDREELADELL